MSRLRENTPSTVECQMPGCSYLQNPNARNTGDKSIEEVYLNTLFLARYLGGACGSRILPEGWILYCRKYYQRHRYRAKNTGWKRTQFDVILRLLNKWES